MNNMEALFLLVWFYLYAGLQFGMISNTVGLFPRAGSFWQVVGWPVFLAIYLFRRLVGSVY